MRDYLLVRELGAIAASSEARKKQIICTKNDKETRNLTSRHKNKIVKNTNAHNRIKRVESVNKKYKLMDRRSINAGVSRLSINASTKQMINEGVELKQFHNGNKQVKRVKQKNPDSSVWTVIDIEENGKIREQVDNGDFNFLQQRKCSDSALTDIRQSIRQTYFKQRKTSEGNLKSVTENSLVEQTLKSTFRNDVSILTNSKFMLPDSKNTNKKSTDCVESNINVANTPRRKNSPGVALRQFFGFTPGKKTKKNILTRIKWRGGKVGYGDDRIQQLDGGFFERFGSLFSATAVKVAPPVAVTLVAQVSVEDVEAAIAESTTTENVDTANGNAAVSNTEHTWSESDSGVGTDLLPDTDSETEESDKAADYIGAALGWNIDELYTEILFEILHNVGRDINYEIGQESLFCYVQEAFKMSNEKHDELFAAAENKEAPEFLLNIEVIEAKELRPKDANGLSDPFVTLYLSSNTAHRYNTSVQYGTLNPVWEEHFSLPVPEKVDKETLCLEVWDFDPAETVREKMGKLTEVRGVKGFRKLIKEIAVTGFVGQHDNELVGKAFIPLDNIPATGMTMWYSLDKKHKLQRQGVLKLRLTFSSDKQARVASQEHRYLLRILILHELEHSKVAPFWWCGNFSAQAETLLVQHAAQSGLCPADIALAEWAVYCSVHVDHPLSFTLFSNLLDKLIKPLQTGTVDEEEVKIFWDSTKKMLPSCFTVIRKIRKKTAGDKNMLKQLLEVLRILSKLSLIEPPEKTDLFPSNMYPWLTYKEDGPNWDIRGTLCDAVTQGASDWFDHILENNASQDNSDEGKMQQMIKIIQLVKSDLQRAVEYYDKIFQEVVNFQYARTLYTMYEKRVAALVEPEVVSICKSLIRLRFDETSYSNSNASDDPLARGTTLFELYLVLQRFVVLGIGLSPTDADNFHVKEFHRWFHGGVAQWLDIAVFKALQRIEKAVELDQLVPVDDTVKYSSSAVDTLAIFYQIKVFWQQLNWPDVEGSYTFVAKIIDDICRCCVFYADKMSERLEGMGEVQDVFEKKFEVTQEWCLAINNIDYVRQYLQPFVSELGMEDIIQKLSDLRSPVEAQRCRTTLQNVIENAVDTVKVKIIDLLDIVATKMTPAMTKLLIEGAELHQQDSNSIDRVMRYLDSNLATLHSYLNADNFHRTLDVVWDHLAKILTDIVDTNLEKRRPPSFFSNLHETLKLMVRSFKQSENSNDCEVLKRVEDLLYLNGLETNDLIHQVHLSRWREQQKVTPSDKAPFGLLTVRCQFQDCKLNIEILNAKNLLAMDSNGSCDSFVRIHLLPEDVFAGVVKPKTQTHNKTQYPLYDETFTIILTPDQRACKSGLILFSIKDKDFLGMSNQYMAEAFMHFNEIPDTPASLSSLEQVNLTLTRPTKLDIDAIVALEHRQGDKLARDFLRKYKQKMGSIVPES